MPDLLGPAFLAAPVLLDARVLAELGVHPGLSVPALAAVLGESTVDVREAVSTLAARGRVVVARDGTVRLPSGPVVAPPPPAQRRSPWKSAAAIAILRLSHEWQAIAVLTRGCPSQRRSPVYQALAQRVEAGTVERLPGRPAKYRLISTLIPAAPAAKES